MNHEECVGVCVCVCGWVGIPLPATLPRHCLHYCWSSPNASPVRVRDYITLISVTTVCLFKKMHFYDEIQLWQPQKLNPPGPQVYKVPSIYLSCILPGSRAKKDNVTSRSDNMPWYCGPTLIEAAGMATKCPRGEHLPCSPAK